MRSFPTLVSNCLAWWFSNLADCFPPRVRSFFADLVFADDTQTTILFENESARVFEINRSGRVAEQEMSAAEDTPTNNLSRLKVRARKCVIAIPNSKVMHRTMTFPQQAEADLASAMQLVVEQVTPVKSDEAHWDWKIVRRDRSAETIDVDLHVAPSWMIVEVHEKAKQNDLNIQRIDCLNDDQSAVLNINLDNASRSLQLSPLKPSFLFALVAVALTVVGMSIVAAQQHQAALNAQNQFDQVRASAQSAIDARTLLQTQHERLTLLNQAQESTIAPAAVIDELARVLPDGSWIFEMSTRDKTVTISGESDQASNLLSLIEGTTLFSDPKFTSALTRGATEDLERFVISFQIDEASTT